MRNTLMISVSVILTLSVNAHAQRFDCQSTVSSPYPIVMSSRHDHSRYAPSVPDVLYSSFVAALDDADDDNFDGVGDFTANPDWVATHLIGLSSQTGGGFREPPISIERPTRWYRSSELSYLWENSGYRPGLDRSYAGIGTVFNRGHYATADHAQRISAEASCNTQVFTNASPQAANLNQGPWQDLEYYSAALSNMAGQVWIVTGPIFDNQQILYIGDAGETPVAIPHAFFKLFVLELPSGAVDFRAIVYDHPTEMTLAGPRPVRGWRRCTTPGRPYDHDAHIVSIAQLEARTGLVFLPNAPHIEILRDYQHEALWEVPDVYWTLRCAEGQGD